MGRQQTSTGVWTVLLAVVSLAAGFSVRLTKLDTMYLPHDFDSNNQPVYGMDMGAGEQLAYEATGKLIYAVGNGIMHVINATDPAKLSYVNGTLLNDLDLTDVETCGGRIFVSYVSKWNPLHGGVRVYQAFSWANGGMELLHDIPIGGQPDMVYPTPNCTIVVAIENETVEMDGQLIDPPGGVGIIRFTNGLGGNPAVTRVNFTKFDNSFDELSQSGVRWVYRGNDTHPNPFSNNVEPEFITFSPDHKFAYIALQENNAIAVIDIDNNNVTAIHGLGFKQWGKLDASDKDGGIHIADWPVYGMYLPDAIHLVRWAGDDYIITANEGDAQEYPVVGFAEEIRGSQINESQIAPGVNNALKEALQDKTKLGRLTFSSVDGQDSDGRIEKFYAYGGRSFSIYRASDMQQVYDSGSELEEKTASLRPDIFNAYVDSQRKPADHMDDRSDNKGPETESLAVGELAGRLLIFVGNERPGTLFVYSVGQEGITPRFEAMTSGIPQDAVRTFQQLYDDRDLYGVDPEFLQYYDANVMAEYPVLLMAGSVSGTVTTFKVEVTGDGTSGGEGVSVGVITILLTVLAAFRLIDI